jgi:hypothetical protein
MVRGPHSDDYCFRWLLRFQSNIIPPSSEQKQHIPCYQTARGPNLSNLNMSLSVKPHEKKQ